MAAARADTSSTASVTATGDTTPGPTSTPRTGKPDTTKASPNTTAPNRADIKPTLSQQPSPDDARDPVTSSDYPRQLAGTEAAKRRTATVSTPTPSNPTAASHPTTRSRSGSRIVVFQFADEDDHQALTVAHMANERGVSRRNSTPSARRSDRGGNSTSAPSTDRISAMCRRLRGCRVDGRVDVGTDPLRISLRPSWIEGQGGAAACTSGRLRLHIDVGAAYRRADSVTPRLRSDGAEHAVDNCTSVRVRNSPLGERGNRGPVYQLDQADRKPCRCSIGATTPSSSGVHPLFGAMTPACCRC